MPRAKRGPKRAQKRKKVLKRSSGFFGVKSNAYRMAKQAVDRADKFATRDRRAKKRQFRSLWIVRINAAVHEHGLSYNRFIQGLKLAGCALDRKVLAELAAAEDRKPFTNLVDLARQALDRTGGATAARA
ncbi:MAG: 50S ribosomal protein L20 [Thermoanaerobaculia bacterium]|nr:MAG: 50S ribosomal protein L20 [Thermoanaerobaculia bacterium]